MFASGLTGKEISARLGKPFNAVSGRITELLEQKLVRKSKETRDGGHIIYLEPTLERWEMLISPPEKDAQPKSAGTVEEIKADIVRLDSQGLCWEAIALAYKHNIGVEIELPPVTI